MESLTVTENELIALKLAAREYLEKHASSFHPDCGTPHPSSNVGSTLAAYNKIYALQHGSSQVTCETMRVPEWLQKMANGERMQ